MDDSSCDPAAGRPRNVSTAYGLAAKAPGKPAGRSNALDNLDREWVFSRATEMTTNTEPTTSLRCPVCRAKVVVALQNEVVIHNAILKVDPATGRVSAKCARCKAWVQVPLRYTGEMTPA